MFDTDVSDRYHLVVMVRDSGGGLDGGEEGGGLSGEREFFFMMYRKLQVFAVILDCLHK